MRRALALAARGRGRVEPNPMVGCVIARGRQIVGEGYHRRFGGPHAEIHALQASGRRARSATAYVTLEPCCHHGKTPPCTDAIVAAGLQRIVVAVADPFAQVRGRGLRRLRAAGIEVAAGLCRSEAMQLNAPYFKLQRNHRPWVILKWAQSLDGKIAAPSGQSKWISGPRSRRWAHRLRARVDAVVVGAGTVIADDPQLTCRCVRPRRIATRIVIDPDLQTPPQARLVRTARRVPTVIVTRRASAGRRRVRAYERAGVEILALRRTRTGLDLGQLLDELGRRAMTNIMIEGGSKTLGAFFDAGLADEAIIFVSRRLIGGRAGPSPLEGLGPATMRDVRRPARTKVTRCGQDDVYQLRFGNRGSGRL